VFRGGLVQYGQNQRLSSEKGRLSIGPAELAIVAFMTPQGETFPVHVKCTLLSI